MAPPFFLRPPSREALRRVHHSSRVLSRAEVDYPVLVIRRQLIHSFMHAALSPEPDLAVAALMIARVEYPKLDAGPYLDQLDAIGRVQHAHCLAIAGFGRLLAGCAAHPVEQLLRRVARDQPGGILRAHLRKPELACT